MFRFPYTLVLERHSKICRKPTKEGYVELNIERSYCKLTLKASEHISLGNSQALKLQVFFFFSSFSSSLPAITQERRGSVYLWSIPLSSELNRENSLDKSDFNNQFVQHWISDEYRHSISKFTKIDNQI